MKNVRTVLIGIFITIIMITIGIKSSVLRIYGDAMYPVQQKGDIVWMIEVSEYESGDVIAFYYDDKILVKRIVAVSGEWIDIHDDGTVFVNQHQLREPYVKEYTSGITDIEFPYQVPKGCVFVLNDQRSSSVDSRNSAIGCVSETEIVGKCIFRLWPPERLGQMR